MVHGTKTKRTSPNKARRTATKDVPKIFDKRTEPNIETTSSIPFEEEELLTPDSLLRAHAARKAGVGILDLLSRKDNLERLASGVSEAMKVPSKTSPPSTPSSSKGHSSSSGRFAGLSNSPAASSLPLPSFSFSFDQELSKGLGADAFQRNVSSPSLLPRTSEPVTSRADQPASNKSLTPLPVKASSSSKKSRKPSPPVKQKSFSEAQRTATSAPPRYKSTATDSVSIPVQLPVRALNHSPPSNPHLDELSSQLRMMLNITPHQP